MNADTDAQHDDAVDLGVYLGLLALTALTVGAAFVAQGRIFAVATALTIAASKAAAIGLYYMNLRRERPLMYVIVGTGVLAVLILLFGIIPDVSFGW